MKLSLVSALRIMRNYYCAYRLSVANYATAVCVLLAINIARLVVRNAYINYTAAVYLTGYFSLPCRVNSSQGAWK